MLFIVVVFEYRFILFSARCVYVADDRILLIKEFINDFAQYRTYYSVTFKNKNEQRNNY